MSDTTTYEPGDRVTAYNREGEVVRAHTSQVYVLFNNGGRYSIVPRDHVKLVEGSA